MSKLKLLTIVDKIITLFFVAVICLLVFLSVTSYGQNVGINNPSPAATALLDLTSTNKGLLVPRMTTMERNAISSPAKALLVYDVSLDEFLFYNGTAWKNLYSDKSGWGLNGNGGLSTSNFIGTTDSIPLKFKVYNNNAGLIDAGNTVLGYITDASANELSCIMGAYAGTHAPYFTSQNVFIGYLSGGSTTYGSYNTFMGAYSGWKNTTGNENVFIGTNAGWSNTTGYENVYIGHYAGYSAVSAGHNVFIGDGSGYSSVGTENTFVGSGSGNYLKNGNSNTYIGRSAGSLDTTGSNNVMLGVKAGFNLLNGSNNTFLGTEAKGTAAISNAVAIGYNANVTANNSFVLGGTGVDALKVGIGVTAPSAELEVNGYTMLGSAAPKIQMVKINATTPAAQGTTVNIMHGLTLSKIISVSVIVEASSATYVPPSYTSLTGYEFNYRLNSSNIVFANIAGNSANILSKPVRVLITYEQ